jgi:hypothetical protein
MILTHGFEKNKRRKKIHGAKEDEEAPGELAQIEEENMEVRKKKEEKKKEALCSHEGIKLLIRHLVPIWLKDLCRIYSIS